MKVEILQEIWFHSYEEDHRPYFATIDRRTGTFKERQVAQGERIATHLIQYDQMDMFFSPLRFKGPRTNNTASLPGVLYADLDGVEYKHLKVPQPSVLWETSSGNYQAVWFLAEAPPDAVRWADVNRRLTYATHADKGGWHASKLLRIPKTRNFKYPEAPLGQVVHYDPDHRVDFLEYEDRLPTVERVFTTDSECPNPLNHSTWLMYVKGYWDALSLEQRSLLAAKHQQDRSSAIVRLSNDLKRDGFDATARFHLIWGVNWNKWRTDRHNPSYLWQVVNS